jgi:hypothetical protein
MTARSGNRSSPLLSRAQRTRSDLGSKDEGALIVTESASSARQAFQSAMGLSLGQAMRA